MKQEELGPFDYNDGLNIVPSNSIRIGASGLQDYFDYTSSWYRQNLLGEDGFLGNTASTLGTVVHHIMEEAGNNRQPSTSAIEEYVLSQAAENPEVDTHVILANYKQMGMEGVNNYLHKPGNMPTRTEDFLYHEVTTSNSISIGVGGSCDAVIMDSPVMDKQPAISYQCPTGSSSGGMIIDYKTTGSLTAPTTINYKYRAQLLTYAWLYRKLGYTVDRIRLVYITRNNVGRVGKTGKPLPDKPSKVTTVTETITDADFDEIEGKFTIIAESTKLFIERPELRHIIAQDTRLKGCKLPNEK